MESKNPQPAVAVPGASGAVLGTSARASSSPIAITPVHRVLHRFSRDELSGFISIAIDLLDLADGDVDAELNGDELDGNGSEEDFINHGANWLGHPGCPVSDPGGSVGDEM